MALTGLPVFGCFAVPVVASYWYATPMLLGPDPIGSATSSIVVLLCFSIGWRGVTPERLPVWLDGYYTLNATA
jgi:hypothetical protein